MPVTFNHRKNRNSLQGPQAVLPIIFSERLPGSLLDVGCGVGNWAKAAIDLGVEDTFGLDGVQLAPDDLLMPADRFRTQDLTQNWNLGRRFDMVISLEVGEHLESKVSLVFVKSLASHTDTVVFSAACPGQAGQHHINCQWPVFWQELFNSQGFRCDDALRWKIWNDSLVEPWYRQNIFVAVRDPRNAGKEERIRPVVHPEFLFGQDYETTRNARFDSSIAIEGGGMPVGWYLKTPFVGLGSKLVNRMRARPR